MGLLRPLSTFYKTLVQARNFAFDRGYKKIYSVDVPVISVGNITVGGTGKTPIILHLIEWCLSQGLRPGVVSRGYKGEFNGVVRVDVESTENPAKFFGDEPSMIATNFPQVPVYVCPDRIHAARALLAATPVDLILADDAFQHRSLHRDLDIVVLDTLEKIKNYKLLPEGRGREDFTALNRADYVILNKVNLASINEVKKLKDKIKFTLGDKVPVVDCEYVASEVLRLKNHMPVELSEDDKLLLVSGVGRPESFEKLLAGSKAQIVRHLAYDDHYDYQLKDIQEIRRRAGKLGANKIVLTEKDAIKIAHYVDDDVFCFVKLKLKMDSEIEKLYKDIIAKTS